MSVKKIILGFLNAAVRIGILVALCIIIKNICLTSYDYGYRVFSEEPVTTGEGFDKDVIIPIGSSASDIGKILKNNGLVRDDKLFFVQEMVSSYRGKLQPGSYTLNTSMTAEEMMKIMAGEEEEDGEEDDTAGSAGTAGSSDVTADATSESGAVDLDVSGLETSENATQETGEDSADAEPEAVMEQ
ncbi:MAG: endolytic transglycosylase MltG [Lachnospiraceae bacterium]|nr:endolytic transglycosylase MltG [Lachnospiraceae bacterium]